MDKKIKKALVSVYRKENLEKILPRLQEQGIEVISTGGTADYLQDQGLEVTAVEDLTSFPSVFGGRVKTLHPRIFGGILRRSEDPSDQEEQKKFDIPGIDLVVVDLYPFEETLESSSDEKEIIEKIDIGGISLIRAAAKNFRDVLVIPSFQDLPMLEKILLEKGGVSSLSERKTMAARAFDISAHYDRAISGYFHDGEGDEKLYTFSWSEKKHLRYGENPHQQGTYYGDLEAAFEKLSGKDLSYNNLVDTEAGMDLIREFEEPSCVILKHTNACGVASRENLHEAWQDALAGDPVSAFGGIILFNREVDVRVATAVNEIFYEVILAPSYTEEALELLTRKKKRIVLRSENAPLRKKQFRAVLNGILEQDNDDFTESSDNLECVTRQKPSSGQIEDLLFANKVVKHLKSNAIALVKDKQLVGIGTGQTSRVDALKQAIDKAKKFDLPLEGSGMASDAFFPFPDCVEIAYEAGIRTVIQPGGSVRDTDSIEYCDGHKMAMVMTGHRHFKH